MVEKLNQRSDCFSLVLNEPKGVDETLYKFKNSYHILTNLCTSEFDTVYCAVIKHDKDLDEYGNVKTQHYHVVMQIGYISRLQTVLNHICDLFNCSPTQVSIEKCNSLIMQTRYLIHLDDFDKARYSVVDIETNKRDFVTKCMKYIKSVTSVDDLISIVRAYPNLLELMTVLGADTYKKYRVIINDIRNELYKHY